MKNVAFIPLRGGSKSIPMKNIKLLAGKPLAHWTISAALQSPLIDKVVVSTDSDEIQKALSYLGNPRLEFFRRSPDTATDTASTESALLEYFLRSPCENGILIQATSPMLEAIHLTEALQKFTEFKFDSMLSLVRSRRFYWAEDEENQLVHPLNYSPAARPRRQDFSGTMVENGAFYIFKQDRFLKDRVRLFGRIGGYEMPENTFIEIDEVEDWLAVEKLLANSRRPTS
jgi:CMP-N-acetylneuraminic acid synthetase